MIRTITADNIANRHLPTDLTGVYWPDTDWRECRAHLEANAQSYREFGTDQAVILTGRVHCDSCRERDELDRGARRDLTPPGGDNPMIVPRLLDAETGADLGPATPEQITASDAAAALDAGAGIILIDGRGNVITPGDEYQPWVCQPVNEVYTQ